MQSEISCKPKLNLILWIKQPYITLLFGLLIDITFTNLISTRIDNILMDLCCGRRY